MSSKNPPSDSGGGDVGEPLIVVGTPVAEEEGRPTVVVRCDKCGQIIPDTGKRCTCHEVYFYDKKAGIYFTYRLNDIKVALVRSLMRLLLLFMFFVLYVIFWGVSDVAILGLTLASCAGTFVGLNFLGISCWAGFFAVLVRGITIGSQFASVTIHWKA
jgi:hypothetical protein